MAALHVLYDFCEHPEYISQLREEIDHALIEDGGWRKSTPGKLWKLDSFMKESQRLSPPSLLTMSRVALQPITFADGLHLPRGTHFSMACGPLLQDQSIVHDPDTFNGFRYSMQRQQTGESSQHQFASTDKNNLNFGHGRYACPGRFFASHEIKILVAEILLRFDIRFPQGKGRAKNLAAFEYGFPDPEGIIEIKRRRNSGKTSSVKGEE
ncbi:MAG: hypothetical protein Q9222_004857 [Ikaeria aurantiellina]